ncbi:MAG: hypothetical protein MJ233_02360 [Mycoplasmoidaceae bacterium]|nr:hypothetical protein [Mycoplasmoidaceae bacterium]
MTKTTQIENFDMVNGLGTISFSPELITNIIKKVLSAYPRYEYVAHTIEKIDNNYYEISVRITSKNKEHNFKVIDKMHKDLLLVMKQSLSLTCVVVLNLENE